MASSSSSISFDVFICFNGEDVRDGFISHLHDALSRKKIEAFAADWHERRDEISPNLVRAISTSKLSLVVFSENYAFSKCCLDELVEILRCRNTKGHSVVPIFYHVDPSDVRKQTGSFGEAFGEHEKRVLQMHRLKKWKDALTEAANLSGWDSSVFRPESLLVEEIAGDVLKKLNVMSLEENAVASASMFLKLIGIDSRVEKVMSLLNIGSHEILMVGIWGMGGIGKTTIAEAVYNRISLDFEVSYFFRNVREAEEKGELFRLKDEFLSQVMGNREPHFGAYGIRPDLIKFRLRRKRLLIVLDDVNNLSQLETLLEDRDGFGAGSRIIVTTRDKQTLESLDMKQNIYCVEKLNEEEASQLFRLYAFAPGDVNESYDQLAMNVVGYAKGVPLALKVLGSSLRGKKKQLWENALRKLKRIPNLKILDVLGNSYDSLDHEETKDIFLDIACFFKGQDIGYAASILDPCYVSFVSSLQVLRDKALITIRRNSLEMHDLLQELGQDIVHRESKMEPGKRSRLWMPEDVHHVLKRNSGTATVRGMFADMSKIKEVTIQQDAFERMYNLKFLRFYGYSEISHKMYPSHGLKSLPDELRYLCWEGYPLKSLPHAFRPQNLVELDLSYSNLNQLWNGTQNLRSLKILNMEQSKKLLEVPDLSLATNLEHIHLAGCQELVNIPSSIGHLQKLAELRLRDCKKLKCLPTDIDLRSLECLDLIGCSQIDEFPDISTNIQEISLSGTSIKEVPFSIKRLSRLVTLRLGDCLGLKNLPDSFQFLDSLETLDLRGCRNIRKLPDLPEKIENLYLEETGIQVLSCSTGSLSMLSVLNISSCGSLEILPKEIWNLKSLTGLSLSDCSKLEEIPQVMDTNEFLEVVSLSGTAIRELPSSIERLISLETLSLNNCQNLSVLPETLWNLENLNSIEAHGTSIRQLPPFAKDMVKLQYLYISGCDSRPPVPLSLPPLSRLPSLNILRLRDLHIVHIPEDIGYLKSLKQLDLSGNDFEMLPASIKHLSKLEWLDLSHCRRLESLPELPSCLQNFDAHDCVSLGAVSGNMEFVISAINGMYIFSNCFRLQGDVSFKILASAKLLFQRMAQQSAWRSRQVMMCLPGSDFPDWFIHWVRGPSMTLRLPSNWYNGEYTGFALCISVAFMDYFADTNFIVLCEYLFKSKEGDYIEKSAYFFPWSGFEIENRMVISSNTWTPIKVQHRYLGSDHVFLFYDECAFTDVAAINSNWIYETVTLNFHVLDQTNEPLKCCRVNKCGCYVLPALSAD